MSRPAIISGLGLFSARLARLTIHAAPRGHGLCIRRAHTTDAPTPLTINFLSTLPEHTWVPQGVGGRNTTISPGRDSLFAFATVEHLMSALAGLDVRDAIVELEGPEVPILDGSALQFVDSIAGLESAAPHGARSPGSRAEADSPNQSPLVLSGPVEVVDQRSGARIRAIPRDRPGTSYSYVLDYGPHSRFPRQAAEFDSARGNYTRDVAPARTFCLLHEARAMQGMGLFTHLTPRDMLVLEEGGAPIDNSLRFENEPARHKLLDLIGDVALLGRPIQADIFAERSGHALTHDLVREILRSTL